MAEKIEISITSEEQMAAGARIRLRFQRGGTRCPAVLLLPTGAHASPAALLIHGLHMDKGRMSEFVGLPLLRYGIASLALDLPLHGERRSSIDPAALLSPFEMMKHWRVALDEAGMALRYLSKRPELDPRKISLVGYSLGGFLGQKVAAQDAAVRALVLASWGDLPSYTPFISVVRAFVDPIRLVHQMNGRPLLMINGKHDNHIPPEQAQRLFQAAASPKEIIWCEAGHALDASAVENAAAWLARKFAACEHGSRAFWSTLV